MNIIETNLQFGALDKRKSINRIILHNSGVSVLQSVEIIHNYHKNTKGWAGIGYHFYVRKDGSIYRGRPIWAVGAHAGGSNYDSIGVCFEGNFDVETMGQVQLEAGKELVAYLKKEYGLSKVQGHRDVGNTSCPGKNFPFNEIAYGVTDIGETKIYNFTTFVKELQSAIGAKVDGIAGKETLSKTPTLSKTKNRIHKAVKVVQEYLYYLGYTEVGKADGIAGIKFDTAVKHFQKDNGCVSDGELTAKCKTWKKILKIN